MEEFTLQALRKVGKGTAEKTSHQTAEENSQWRCERDVTW